GHILLIQGGKIALDLRIQKIELIIQCRETRGDLSPCLSKCLDTECEHLCDQFSHVGHCASGFLKSCNWQHEEMRVKVELLGCGMWFTFRQAAFRQGREPSSTRNEQ